MSDTSTTKARTETIEIDGDEYTVEAWHTETETDVWTDLAIVDVYGDLIAERVESDWLSDGEVETLARRIEERAERTSYLPATLRECGWTPVVTPVAA